VKKVPARVTRPQVPSLLEIETGITIMSLRDRVMVQLLCYCGLRPSGAIALRWDDVRDGLGRMRWRAAS
jgi:integrase